jgi:hypothetical protein
MAGFLVPMQNACHEDGDGPYTPPSGRDVDRGWAASNVIETARNHRYSLEILSPLVGFSGHSTLQYAFKITRPSPEFDVITIHNGQDEIYRPGKNRWNPVDITFYEIFVGSGAGAGRHSTLIDQAALLIYNWWGVNMLDLTRSALNRSKRYLKNCGIAMLDGGNNPIWRYYLLNCWPVKVTPSELSYQDSEIASITITLRYDKAIEMSLSRTTSSIEPLAGNSIESPEALQPKTGTMAPLVRAT